MNEEDDAGNRRKGPASSGAWVGLISLAISVFLTAAGMIASGAVLFDDVGELKEDLASLKVTVAALSASTGNNERLIKAETNIENLMQEVRRLRWQARGYTPEAPKP